MRLKELYESKIKLVADLRVIADRVNSEGHEYSVEDDAAFQKCKSAIEALEKRIEVEKTYDAVSKQSAAASDNAPKIFKNTAEEFSHEMTANDHRLALTGWLSNGDATDAESAAMNRCGVRVGQQDFVIKLHGTASAGELQDRWRNGTAAERAALLNGNIGAAGMLKGTTTAGGYMVPPGRIANAIEIAMLAFGGVRQVADVFKTTDGSPFYVPTSTDTSNTGEMVAEQATIGSTVDPTIGQKALGAYKMSSKLSKFSREMREDSAFDIETYIGRNLGERLGRIENSYYTTGAGSTEPAGVVTGSTAGVTAGSATVVTVDELITLYHAIDPAYLEAGASWMFNNGTALKLRLLKDAGGHYIWQDNVNNGLSGGFVSTLLGRPVTINQQMPAMTTGLKPVLFGNFKKMLIRDVNEIRLRLLSELYAATDEEGMIAFHRTDSIVVAPLALYRITMA